MYRLHYRYYTATIGSASPYIAVILTITFLVCIAKRIQIASHLMNGVPYGSIGDCSKSGWVNKDLFVIWLKRFQRNTNSTPANPVRLISDNYVSHISLDIWKFLHESGIKCFTIPPHTSHRLQQLYVTFKPLKTNDGEHIRRWLV